MSSDPAFLVLEFTIDELVSDVSSVEVSSVDIEEINSVDPPVIVEVEDSDSLSTELDDRSD